MFRTLVLTAALLASPVALACGGDCASGNCPMKNHAAAAPTDDVDAAAGTKVTLAVTGMKCGNCSSKITAALKGLDGVNAVAVDHETGEAKIAFDAKKLDNAKLIETITTVGFTATAPTA